jgi:hypothetical protein
MRAQYMQDENDEKGEAEIGLVLHRMIRKVQGEIQDSLLFTEREYPKVITEISSFA